MVSKQEISVWMAKLLDEYGYSEQRVRERIWMNDKNSLAKTISTQEITADKQIEKFLVGSRREGISLFGESDIDLMQINKAIVCTDKIKNLKGDRHGREILRIDTKNAPSGYAFLQYNTNDNMDNAPSNTLKYSLVETRSGTRMSSSRFMELNEDVFYKSQGYIGRNTVYKERKGPSIPKHVKNGALLDWYLKHYNIDSNQDIDFVRGFECHFPALMNSWINRKRPHNWPSSDVIQKVADLPIYIVPVGLSNSIDEDLQWRFSFTMAEIHLVRSLDETQRKALIVLRLIAKYQLQPIAPEMTSYIMKNVTFWVAEKRDNSTIDNSHLIDRVLEAIEFLLGCVERRVLKHYFIPERNLFQGNVHGKTRKELLEKLHDIKKNGILMLGEAYKSDNMHIDFPVLGNILENRNILNHCDKFDTLRNFSMSTSELANYFTYSFHCKFWFMVMFYGNFCLFLAFGTRWFSDPMGIDLTKKASEQKRFWYKSTVITRNKSKTKSLVRMERCSWLISMACETSERFQKYSLPLKLVWVVYFLYSMYILYLRCLF